MGAEAGDSGVLLLLPGHSSACPTLSGLRSVVEGPRARGGSSVGVTAQTRHTPPALAISAPSGI